MDMDMDMDMDMVMSDADFALGVIKPGHLHQRCHSATRMMGPETDIIHIQTRSILPSPSPIETMSQPTPEFVMEAQGIAFNFVQLRITIASLEEFSLDNAMYEEMAFQVEHMQRAFQEQVRQFKATFAPEKNIQMPRMSKSHYAFEMVHTPAA